MFKFTFGSLALLSLLVLCCRGSTDQTIFGLSKGFDDAEFMKNYVCDKNHNYTVRVVLRDPLIMEIDNFLAPGEADHLIMLGQPLMKQSGLVDDENNNPDLTVRSSFSAFLERSQDDVVSCIEQRMSYFSNKPTPNIEPLQIVWYRNQQEYKPHFDFFLPGQVGSERELSRGGQRVITFFVYLNDVPLAHGGATSFPEVGISVQPVKNKAAFWYDVDVKGVEDTRVLHAGDPIHDYQKYGMNGWIREGAFK